VRGAVAEGEQRVEVAQGRPALVALHVLRLVEDQHGARGLEQVYRRLALQPLGGQEQQVPRLVERGQRHDHQLHTVALGKLSHLGDALRAVLAPPVRETVEHLGEVLPGDLEGLQHPFADGDRGHHDDELPQAVALSKGEGGAEVDVGLPGAGLHLDRVVVEGHGLLLRGAVELAGDQLEPLVSQALREIALLDGAEVVEEHLVGQVKPVGHGGKAAARTHGLVGGDVRLAVEQVGDGPHRVELERLVGIEAKLHGDTPVGASDER